MFSRRAAPAPLSDELFAGGAPVLLGAVNGGMGLRVKNTFLDAPSGLTPSSMKHDFTKPLLTAPAGLSKTIALPGRLSGASGMAELGAEDVELREPAAADSCSLASIDDDAGDDEDHDDSDDESLAGEQPILNQEDIPKPPPGALHPSIGSVAHTSGACKRCCFFPRGRCMNGYNCEFCHYSHENRKRKNKKKVKKVTLATAVGPDLGRSTSAEMPVMAAAAPMAGFVSLAQDLQPRQSALQQSFVACMGADGRPMAQVMVPFQAPMNSQQVVMCTSLQPQAQGYCGSYAEAQQPGPLSFAPMAGAPVGGASHSATRIHRLPPAMSQGLGMSHHEVPSMPSMYDSAPPPPMASPKFLGASSAGAPPPPMTSPKVSGYIGVHNLPWLG